MSNKQQWARSLTQSSDGVLTCTYVTGLQRKANTQTRDDLSLQSDDSGNWGSTAMFLTSILKKNPNTLQLTTHVRCSTCFACGTDNKIYDFDWYKKRVLFLVKTDLVEILKKKKSIFLFGRFMPFKPALVPGLRVLFWLAMTWIENHSFSLLNECHYLAVGYNYSSISKNFISVYNSSGIGILLMFHFVVLKVFWPYIEIWRLFPE